MWPLTLEVSKLSTSSLSMELIFTSEMRSVYEFPRNVYSPVNFVLVQDGVSAYEVAEMKNFKELYSKLKPQEVHMTCNLLGDYIFLCTQIPTRGSQRYDYKEIKASVKSVVKNLRRGPLCLYSEKQTDIAMLEEKLQKRHVDEL